MNYFTTPNSSDVAFSVSQLNRQIQQLLEASLPWILVEGEISNFSQPSSGHWYFTLKDDKAQIRCTMFKNRNQAVRIRPKEGDFVKVRAKVTFYGPRGDCQLSIETLESAGEGALQVAFERLKLKLQLEGLFDPSLKKTLPKNPQRIAIITSATGAVIRDIITTFRRRFPLTELTLFPTLVQGNGASESIIKQLQRADNNKYFDAIIVGRGGGSLEDLWCFNDEKLARAIASTKTPIVCAVGHETDFTIADFVADVRAATPTAAAELLSPDRTHLLTNIDQHSRRLQQYATRLLQEQQQRLDFLSQRLRHPHERLQQQFQRVQTQQKQLINAMQSRLNTEQMHGKHLSQRLLNNTPDKRYQHHHNQLKHYQQRLTLALQSQLANKQTHFINLVEKLELVSPLNILIRGYAIAQHQHQVISSVKSVQTGDRIDVRLQDGALDCQIIQVMPS